MTRLELFKQMVLTPDAIRGAGKGLPLLLYVALHVGKNNMLKTSYDDLEKILGAPASTLKKWRDCLEDNNVIEAVTGKGSMMLKFVPPYDAIATCELGDLSEVRVLSTPGMKQITKDMTQMDSLSVIISLGKIAEKVGRLEQSMVSRNEERN